MPYIIDQNARPVIFGECLFDHYPDGNKILAGAPLAVAWHLQGFGLRPLLITRIGQDTEGELALATMHQWGMDTRGVQIDPHHSTGSVLLNRKDGENHFEIKAEQAWDHITSNLAIEWVHTLPCSLLYAGSLAQRNKVSRQTLQRIIEDTKLPVFMDINIRHPWIDDATIEHCLDQAAWLKLNDIELDQITDKQGQSDSGLVNVIKSIRSKYDIETVYLTRADKGAMSVSDTAGYKHKINKAITLVDSVGAGDAFTAVCILGLHKGWKQQQILTRANEFAAKICQQQGATTLTKKDYSNYLKKWI